MQQQNPNLSKKKKQLNNYARYSSLAFQMFVIIGAGTFGGYKLNQWAGLEFPVFTLIFSVLSVVLAIYFAIKDLMRFNK